MNIEEYTALSGVAKVEWAEAHLEEYGMLMAELEQEQEAEMAKVTIVGYWRPVDLSCADSTVQSALADVERCRKGEQTRRYVSKLDLARAGVGSKLEFLEKAYQREVARRDELMAFPVPEADTLDPATATKLADWLDDGVEVASYRGSSTCRICGIRNGSTELQNGKYRYPSGLSHYVRDHRVAVPGLPVPS